VETPLILLALACQVPIQPLPEDTQAPPPQPPQIETITATCSSSEDKRILEVHTLGWTGGGRVSFTLDGRSIEEHPLDSIEADADGAWDTLRLDLEIVANPQDVARGSRSAYLCDAESPLSVRLAVYSTGTSEEADCRSWGPDQAWELIGDYPDCELTLDPSERGD
jgi:hypothetical protein